MAGTAKPAPPPTPAALRIAVEAGPLAVVAAVDLQQSSGLELATGVVSVRQEPEEGGVAMYRLRLPPQGDR